MKECKEHKYKPAQQDNDLFGDVRSEIRNYGTPEAKWDRYLLLYCTSCGDTKKVWVGEEMKPV